MKLIRPVGDLAQAYVDKYPIEMPDSNSEADAPICAHGAVFSGTNLDIGTRFLLRFLPEMPEAATAVDLGCGTGILAAMYARAHPASAVIATDQSAAAAASAAATAKANGLDGQV